MITVIQILMILFALFAWSRAALRLKRKELGPGEFVFWSVILVGVIVFASLPGILDDVSQFVGVQRPIDLAVYASIILLFYLMFRIYSAVESQSQQMTKIVREIAIRKRKK